MPNFQDALSVPGLARPHPYFSTVEIPPFLTAADRAKYFPPLRHPVFIRCRQSTALLEVCAKTPLMHKAGNQRRPLFNLGTIQRDPVNPRCSQVPTFNNIL